MLIATAIGGASLFTYFYERERIAYFDRLEMKVSALTEEHGNIFEKARESQLYANTALENRIASWRGRNDVNERFDAVFAKQEDGTYRSRDHDFDGALSEDGHWVYGTGAFIAPRKNLTVENKTQLLAARDIVSSHGEAALYWADNFYYYTPGSDLIIFAPRRHDRLEFYRKTAPADFSFKDRIIIRNVLPENNPERAMRCTGLENIIYDRTGRRLTTGCQTPTDLGDEHIGAFGVSFLLNGWLAEVISEPIEGSKPFIIQADGEMIAHETLIDRSGGEAFAKQFAVDLQADALLETIVASGAASGTTFFEPWDAYVSYAKFSGPSWYFIARVPKEQVWAAAFSTAWPIAVFGVTIGFALIIIMAVVLRRVIAQPLETLTTEAERDIRQKRTFIRADRFQKRRNRLSGALISKTR